ncbi:MAG: hypothetical protein ACI83B_003698 [Sediminicola sp.]|jgi:hypothetical protein
MYDKAESACYAYSHATQLSWIKGDVERVRYFKPYHRRAVAHFAKH